MTVKLVYIEGAVDGYIDVDGDGDVEGMVTIIFL